MTRGLLTACCVLALAGCGSVGNTPKDGGGGSGGGSAGTGGGSPDGGAGSGGASPDGGAGSGGGGSAGGGSGGGGTAGAGQDGSADSARGGSDGSADGGDAAASVPVSCQEVKQRNAAAASGVFTIAPLGTTTQQVFCEMTVDGGGWTAFYVGDNGNPSTHFELAADNCPDPANSCLRRLPVTIDATHDFAVKCGASVVKFKVPASPPGVLDYFKNGLTHQWQPVTNAVTIDLAVVGKANLVKAFWTGDGSTNRGWIAAGDQNTVTTTFANGYLLNDSWNFCNGMADSTSRVMLFYR